jgi:class 3 adenylate cyclase
MESPEAFIPIDRYYALTEKRELPDRPQGTALFADISGFTPITESLAESLGPKRGAEEMARHLNRVYDALIAQVHVYGGSVISFVATLSRVGSTVTMEDGPRPAH